MSEEINASVEALSITDEANAETAAAPSAESPAAVQPQPDRKKGLVRIFVGDLSSTTNEESFRQYFEQWGPVERVIIKHPQVRVGAQFTRSFGFLTVIGEDVADSILSASHTIDGRKVGQPERAKPMRSERDRRPFPGSAESAPTTPSDGGSNGGYWSSAFNSATWSETSTRKIFVGGLSHQTKEKGLQVYFSQFGAISDVVVMTEGNTKRPRGFGFVTFEDPTSVAIVARTRYHPVDGRFVEVKPAVPRECINAPISASSTPSRPPYGAEYCSPADYGANGPSNANMNEWYPGYNGSFPHGNNVMGGAGGVTLVAAGVPIYNGYAPMAYNNMMMPMGSVPVMRAPTPEDQMMVNVVPNVVSPTGAVATPGHMAPVMNPNANLPPVPPPGAAPMQGIMNIQGGNMVQYMPAQVQQSW